MNRRGFLKTLAAVGVAAGIAPRLIAEARAHPLFSGELGTYEGVTIHHASSFTRSLQEFDFGQKVGLCASLELSGARWRSAVLILKSNWEEFTERQREQTWRMVERHTFKCATTAGGLGTRRTAA